MKFLSYAQNFEDVMLWRALRPVTHGFYIDVGAQGPERDSVTKAFYDSGWNGINIEPNRAYFLELKERRPADTNLCVALGDRDDTLVLNCIEDSGLSTLLESIALQHLQNGWQITQQEVTVTTLQAIWRRHVPSGQEVHFLKIDVEGFEEAVLRGNDWSRNRPWIVLVEATHPNTQLETSALWEPVLFSVSYTFAYADGLNRFYVANEHSDLLSAFKYGPNVFDQFVLVGQHLAECRAQQAEAELQEYQIRAEHFRKKYQLAETRFVQAQSRALSAEAAAASSSRQLDVILASKWWRFSAPIRRIGIELNRILLGFFCWSSFLLESERPRREEDQMSPRTKEVLMKLEAGLAQKQQRDH